MERSDEVETIRRALDGVPLPKGVRKVDFELGQDSTNEDSVTPWISIQPDLPSDRGTMARLNAFAERLRDRIFASGLGRFPYVRYKTARTAPAP